MSRPDPLASFKVRGAIGSRAELESAVYDLFDALETAEDDIISLLSTILDTPYGVVELLLTSRNDSAFSFRERIIKTLHKSSSTPPPAFISCAERLGAFLMGLPPSEIALDRSVTEKYNAFTATLAASNPPESDFYVAKETKSAAKSQPKPDARKKRKSKYISLSITLPVPQGEDEPNSPVEVKSPSSPITPLVALPEKPSLSEQLRECLEIFFSACIEETIEDWALDNLLRLLKPEKDSPEPASSAASKAPDPPSPVKGSICAGSPIKPKFVAPASSLLGPGEISRYLKDAAHPKFGDWPVVVSQRGIKHLRQYVTRDREAFSRIEKKIGQLSMGFFPASNQIELLNKDFGIPIYTADLGGDLRLLYHIDFGAPTSTTDESQFIRVFGIFLQSGLDTAFWKSVAAQLARRGPEYVKRCTERAESRYRTSRGGKEVKTTPPKLSSPLTESHWNAQGADDEIDESHFLELHRILALEKFVPLSQTFFEAIQKYDETSFMFAVSSPEYRIIRHPSSCLVLGRSGTGKTTCMLFRMIALDIAAEKYGRPLRQMFVTQSRTLARRVRSYCMQLKQTEANEVGVAAGDQAPGLSLLEMDESAEEIGFLPEKFSELEDSHFPLFLTYDQLCRLLEMDYGVHFSPSNAVDSSLRRAKGLASSGARTPLISFEYFETGIWPHLDEKVKRGLHSAHVYSEFMGIIKGSEASLATAKRYLDRDAYEGQSKRTHSGDEDERSRIYKLFEAYQKSRPSKSYDAADRVHILLNALNENGVAGKPLDFLYVDEAQDNLIVDAALLRALCPNPHGLFFAGDTAQTISVGSAFRFSELKAFLFHLERQDQNAKRSGRKPIDPSFFQLSTNYRSHSGIVNVAAYIVRLIATYFEWSIDSLTPEVSLVDVSAHKPAFFSGREDQSDFLQLISDQKSGKVELGAHQVIIVRDEIAAQKLQAYIGKGAVVLTLYESKGMEFDDVLLYDFFTDSVATATDWRALLHAQHDGKRFDERRHSILQSELKSLYVGLTRARERVWIWDRSDKGRDMENLLVTSLLATAHDVTEAVPQLGVSSAPEEWTKQARQYFSKQLFSEAAFCFQKAEEDWWASVALVYGERKVTGRLPEKHPRRLPAFTEVAQKFDRLAQRAMVSNDTMNARLLFVNAAECYTVLPDYMAAANAFSRAERWTEAAYNYRMAGDFDSAVEVINGHDVDPRISESIVYAAKFIFSRKRDADSLQKARKLCQDKDEFIDFLLDHGLEEQRIIFLDSITEHEEAAAALWSAGDHVSAILRYRRATTPSAQQKAISCLLEGVRNHVSFGDIYGRPSEKLSRLFGLSKNIGLSDIDRSELELLQAVASNHTAKLKSLGRQCNERQSLHYAILALDAWSQSGAIQSIESGTEADVVDVLELCQKFARVIETVVRAPEVLDEPAFQQLFGVELVEQGESFIGLAQARVHPHSFIHRRLAPRNSAAVVFSKPVVYDLTRQVLLARRNDLLDNVDWLARKSRAFEVCTRYLTTGRCGYAEEGSCWRDHVASRDITIESFNFRFRLHVMLIALLDRYTAVWGASNDLDIERNRLTRQKIWISRLFALCYPATPKAGNLSDVTPELIPEYSTAIPVVKTWLQEVFRSLRPGDNPKFFLTNLLITSLLATAFDYNGAVLYLWKAQWNSDMDVALRDGLIQPANGRPAAGSALTWFAKNTPARTNLGVHFLEHALTGQVWLDVDVVVSFIEEVSVQLIVNRYAHRYEAYHGLTLPRSWLLRGFVRGASHQPNGSMPFRLVATLGNFLNLLLQKGETGWLQVKGIWLSEASLSNRCHAIARVCRCLALIGYNTVNDRLKDRIVTIFRGMGYFSSTWPEISGYSAAYSWPGVVKALRAPINSSPLDELVVVRQKEGAPPVPGITSVFCPDERKLASKLQIGPGAPAITLQGQVPATGAPPVASPSASKVVEDEADGADDDGAQADDGAQIQGEGFTEEDERSAKVLQAFFRRHRKRAGDHISTAFEQLAESLKSRPEPYRPQRLTLLCIRGPLPHVINYLQALKDICQTAVSGVNKEMQASKHEELDKLHAKGVQIRGLRNSVSKLIKDLLPSSTFYYNEATKTPVSAAEITAKVKDIPELTAKVKALATIPTEVEVHYDLGVEPLLSNRFPSPTKAPTAKKTQRPALNTDDLDGFEDY